MKISKVRNMIQGFLVDKVAIVGGRELLSRTMRTTMIKVGNRAIYSLFFHLIFRLKYNSHKIHIFQPTILHVSYSGRTLATLHDCLL